MEKVLKMAFLVGMLFFSVELFPQKEQNTIEVNSGDDLGNVTDAFQENFFEALKQKAIENHEKAIQALVKCLAFDSALPVVYLELGKNYNALEEYEQAAIYLEKARTAEPGEEAILTELYQTYFMDRQFQKALPVVKELKELNSVFSEDLANLYMLNEHYDEALELLDALDEQWGNSNFRNKLRNQIYAATGNMNAHVENLEERIENDPENEQHYLNLIFVYSEQGNSEKAFELAKKLQDMNPSSELVHLALYKFYLTDDQTGKALKSMKIVFQSEEIDGDTKFNVLNDFLIFVSENPGMEKELLEVVQIFAEEEGDSGIFGELGAFFMESGDKAQALEFFEMSLSEEITDFDVLRNALLLQLELKHSEAAKELSERALENYPSQPLLYLLNGTALNQMNSFREAEEVLNFGLSFLIDNPRMETEFYRQLSVSYKGLDNQKKSDEFRKKAEELEKKYVDE